MSEPVPGSARDDFDRLRILFLRANALDQSSEYTFTCRPRRPGAGWTLRCQSGSVVLEHSGSCLTEIVATIVADLSRKLLLRWRSDGGALQLCGVEPTPFDPEVVVIDADDRDPAIPRRSLPARGGA